jgi:hypothetical protein
MAAQSFPQGIGVVELVPADLEVRPDYGYNAVQVEAVNSNGDGVSMLLDLGASLDFALRIAVACARLRGVMP